MSLPMPMNDHPWYYSAPGFLGRSRDHMKENELLLRPKLGKVFERGYVQPWPGTKSTYGTRVMVEDGGVPAALNGWQSGPNPMPPFCKSKQKVKRERDFQALNRCAVEAGLVTVGEQNQFRATHDITRKSDRRSTQKHWPVKLPPPDFVYGLSTRPSTPIGGLIEHKYQDQWLKDMYAHNLELHEIHRKKVEGKAQPTKASLLRNYQIPVPDEPLWQMPRFTKTARPHLETFRKDQSRERAYKNYENDCISRKGMKGQGVYEQAKEYYK